MELSRLPDAWRQETLFADDLEVGEVHELGSHLVTREEVLEFATDAGP